jgi:hypothetical protein
MHIFLHGHTGLFYCGKTVTSLACGFNALYLISLNKRMLTNMTIVLCFLSRKKYLKKMCLKDEKVQLFYYSFCFKNLYILQRLTFTCSTTVPICESTGIAPKYFPLNFALGKMKCGLLSFTSTTLTLTCRK